MENFGKVDREREREKGFCWYARTHPKKETFSQPGFFYQRSNTSFFFSSRTNNFLVLFAKPKLKPDGSLNNTDDTEKNTFQKKKLRTDAHFEEQTNQLLRG